MSEQTNVSAPNAPDLPARLFSVARAGQLPRSALQPALQQIGYTPSPSAWATFLNNLLLYLGALLLVSGIFFFFAYNWANLHHFAKFGLVQAGIVGAAGLAHYLGLEKLSGKVSLTVAALLVGALLAVFGQFYQTGADSYMLFLLWAILIAGWVFISSFQPLWLVLIVLSNLTAVLFIEQTQPLWFENFYLVASAFFVANAVLLLLWEIARGRVMGWMRNRWLPNLVGLFALIVITISALAWIFESSASNLMPTGYTGVAVGLYLLFIIAIFVIYGRFKQELFMLTIAMFSMIAVATAGLIRLLDEVILGGTIMMILVGLVIVGLSGLAINLLQRISKSWEASA